MRKLLVKVITVLTVLLILGWIAGTQKSIGESEPEPVKCHCGAWEKCPDFDPNNPTWGGHCLDAPDDSYSSACIMDFPCGTDERKDAYCSPKGDECPQGWMGYNWEDKE